jgi:dTDP-4-dehydrorhamnose reductase
MKHAVVLGANGMLGQHVGKYLRQVGWSVTQVSKRFTIQTASDYVETIRSLEASWLINCAGATDEGCDDINLFEANSLLPQVIALYATKQTRIIHASSDAVFADQQEGRLFSELTDSKSRYGLSKRLSELGVLAAGGAVIRCSIVGLDEIKGRGLMSWVLRQEGTVKGFVNQAWNGITALEWAKVCIKIMEEDLRGQLVQPAICLPVSKAELLRAIVKTWQKNVQIEDSLSPCRISRTLIPNLVCPSIDIQLAQLRDFYET